MTGLKSSVKKLEKELSARIPSEIIVYGPETDERGFISVKCNGKLIEYISPQAHENRMLEAVANGDLVCGPDWERWYGKDDEDET